MEVSVESSTLVQYSLVSYSLSGLSPSVKTKVSQRVYGKRSVKRIKGKVYDYSYKGLKDAPSVMVISESTLLLQQHMVDDFIRFLEENGVAYKVVAIWKTR